MNRVCLILTSLCGLRGIFKEPCLISSSLDPWLMDPRLGHSAGTSHRWGFFPGRRQWAPYQKSSNQRVPRETGWPLPSPPMGVCLPSGPHQKMTGREPDLMPAARCLSFPLVCSSRYTCSFHSRWCLRSLRRGSPLHKVGMYYLSSGTQSISVMNHVPKYVMVQ